MRLFCLLILSFLLPAGLNPAPAQAQNHKTSRILRSIDFEERRLGNAENLPMHWIKLTGEGLPHYVNGQFSSEVAHWGQYSFQFILNGGSLIYQYDPAQLPVRPNAHYRIQGYVRTTSLAHARARITGYFVDADNHPLNASITHSQLYASPDNDDSWHLLSIELTAPDNAAYLTVELGLVQPQLYAPATLGERTLYSQDIHGSAWFDDLTISQVPQVTLSTDRPGNIFRASDPLVVHALVNDRVTADLSAQLIVRNAADQVVYQRSGILDRTTTQTLGPGQKRLTLTLGDIKPGWYEVMLDISSSGQSVGRQTIHIIRLADDTIQQAPDPRFGMIATGLPFDGWDDLPGILPLLSAGRVKLAVWSRHGDVQQLNSAKFDRLLEQLQIYGITPTACLVDLPPSIRQKMPNPTWRGILTAPVSAWQPQLAYLVARHANHLDRWQLGDDGSDLYVSDPTMRQVYDRIYDEFAKLIQSPDLAMPWPAWYEMDGKLPATIALAIPPNILPSQIPLYISTLKNQQGHNLSLSLEPLDVHRYGRMVQIQDLAQRIIYALSAGAQRIDLPLPFTVEQAQGKLVKQPSELFMIDRSLISILAGSTYRGKLSLAEGVESFLFDRHGVGVLVLWDRSAGSTVRELALNVTPQAVQMDLWGNVSKLARNNDAEGGKVHLTLGPTPLFLIGVDAQLAQLRAGITVDRPLLESSFEPHTRHIRFTNPYSQAIGGSFRLKAPSGWNITPPTVNFTLNPGETFDRPFTIEFPYNSFAGDKQIQAEFTIHADRTSSFVTPITLKLGLSDVGMQSMGTRDGDDVIIQQIISNYGNKPINYTAFAMVPGQARQERLVTNLAPGQTTLKLYRFTKVQLSPGAHIRVGVKEIDGTRILNDEITIE